MSRPSEASRDGHTRVEYVDKPPAVGVLFNHHSAVLIADTLKKLSPKMRIELVSSGLDLTEDDKRKLDSLEILFTQPNLVQSLKLHLLPNLKWLHCLIAGVDLIVEALQSEKSIPLFPVTRNASYFDLQMAEYVIGMILSRERRIAEVHENQRNQIWNQEVIRQFRPLTDISIGICGFGSIGKEVARVAKTFGIKVYALVRNLPTEPERSPTVDEYRSIGELGDLLSSSDYVVSILPCTPSTNGFYDGEVLSMCRRKKTVFINIGRGNAILESTVIRALNEGWIGHAVLDVFDKEPLPAESPLWGHPGVTITPHISGTHMIPERFVKVALDNYNRFLKGESLLNIVDVNNKGY